MGKAEPVSEAAETPVDAQVATPAGVGVGVAGDERAEIAVQVLVLVLLARRLPAPWRSPLAPDRPGGPYPTRLRGGRVDDPREVAEIAARVAHGGLPWWRRWTTRPPVGWRSARPVGTGVAR